MKMSKSINDYKEAMDNIKISESFYKRTEVLLTELPEVKIEKRPAVSGRRVSAVILSAAACVICLFGVKLAVDGRQTDIVTETVSGETGSVTETVKEADELIDEFGEYDDAGIVAESIDTQSLDGGNAAESVPDSTKPAAASSETEVTTTGTAASKTTAETKPTTTAATEKRVVPGIDPNRSSANTSSEPNDAGNREEPSAAMPNPGASGGASTVEYEDEDFDEDIMDSEDEYDEAVPAASASDDKLFSELSLDNITVDITPYFNMGDVKSGEGTIQRSGMEFKPVLDLIADMDSSATKIGNSSFTSLFSIRIYDDNIDLEFYSIYLTNHESIVITKHSPDGSQVRETYALRREYYEAIRYQLFLLFGAEGDYELFTNLIGGK